MGQFGGLGIVSRLGVVCGLGLFGLCERVRRSLGQFSSLGIVRGLGQQCEYRLLRRLGIVRGLGQFNNGCQREPGPAPEWRKLDYGSVCKITRQVRRKPAAAWGQGFRQIAPHLSC